MNLPVAFEGNILSLLFLKFSTSCYKMECQNQAEKSIQHPTNQAHYTLPRSFL